MSTKEYTGADDVLAKIATYKDDFRPTAEKLHGAITSADVTLYPRLWYGMPGYAKTQTGPVLVYFRKDIYIQFGKTQFAHEEFDGKTCSAVMAWYFTDINDASITKIKAIVQSAAK
jgi:hypothetical protein